MKRVLLVLCMMLSTGFMIAGEEFVSGKYTFEITSSTEVRLERANTTRQFLNLAPTISYEGTTYRVTSIGNYAFYHCTSLVSVTIPNGVKSIGNRAFEGCRALTSLTIPASVMEIGWGAFADCSALTVINIPNGVTEIKTSTFRGCSALRSVVVPENVMTIGWYAFANCESLKSITIPNSVGNMNRAFDNCTSLESITIPNSERSIAGFRGCISLRSVIIPSSIQYISGQSFSGCKSLTEIYYRGTKAQWGSILKDNWNELSYIQVIHCTDGDVWL